MNNQLQILSLFLHNLMVLFELIFICRTEYVETISLPEHGQWHFKIKCTSCSQSFPKEVAFSKYDQHQVIKQSVNFYAKCKNCDRKGSITIDPNSSYRVRADENGNIKEPIAFMQCRGLQIEKVELGNAFTVTVRQSGTVHENADFTDLWCEYDEKISNVAQVENPVIEINRIK